MATLNEPPVGGAVIDESGHVWIHDNSDDDGWVCYHEESDCDERPYYWNWQEVQDDAEGELERWDLHTH